MRSIKPLALILCVFMLLPLAACKPAPDTPEQSSEMQTTAPEESTTAPEEEPEPVIDPIVAMKENLNAIKQGIGATTDTVLYAKDFGAVGDGKTDDGAAIFNAVTEAINQKATLQFEQDKTYYIESVPGNRLTPFLINGADGLTVDGCGSTFLLAPNMQYFEVGASANVKFINCHFDCAVSVYLVGTVKDVQGTKIVFDVDMNPYLDSYDYTAANGFSIQYNEGTQQRPHTFLTKMQKTGEKEVTVTYKGHTYTEGKVVFLPNPGVGHIGSAMCSLKGNTGAILFENIGIHAAPVFCWHISDSQDKVFFENVDLVPSPDNDRQIKMVAWRDGFHCKDNTASLHWNNCESGVLHDDIFNIANTLGEVVTTEDNNVFTVRSYESSGQTFACNPGDTVDIFDVKSGNYLGNGRVRSVRTNADGTRTLTLYYGQTIEKVKEGYLVANRDTGAPGSTITNCHFQGTFRFMRNLYVENTVFDMLQTWIMVSGSVEGPMPGNMDFVGCTFNGGNIQIDAQNYATSKRMNKIGKEITDIGYWGCTFNKSNISTKTMASYTVSDTYTTEELYTVKNAAAVNDPIQIAPTDTDVNAGVTWDWSLFTMPMTGNIASVIPTASLGVNVHDVAGVGSGVLALQAKSGEKLYFDGMSATAIPCLYKKGTSYLIKLTYYTATPVKAKLVIGGKTVTEDLFTESGEWATFSIIHNAASDANTAYIECLGDGEVYLGELTLATFVNANPSITQLEDGHTFSWDGNVTIDGGEAVKLDNVTNAAAKQAMLANPDKFGQTVLHLDGNMGDFNGLTKKSYFAAGTTYRLSIDAYIASPISADSKMFLMVLDSTAGNRTLAEGIFEGEGLYHFEIEWKVGNTGENKLTFYIPNVPASYADIYVGNLTLTKMPGLAPIGNLTVTEYATPTIEQLINSYTFDFSKGYFLDVGKQNYVDTSCLNAYTAQTLANAGFGEYAYYYDETFDALGLAHMLSQHEKRRLTLKMKVYDCQGNLATAPEGAFLILDMKNGTQFGPGYHYTITPDAETPGLYTLTFTGVTPIGTDTFRFYVLEPCAFYIASITVKIQ